VETQSRKSIISIWSEKTMKVTILRENEIRECVGINKEAVDGVALGFTRLVEGKVSLPPIIRVDVEI
jgi:hypothetical protein